MTSPPKPRMGWKTFFDEVDKIKDDIRKLFKIADPTPVGAVFDFAGQSLPDGYLLCDGTIYNIVDYPDLAAYLGTLYGGNGTTTFGVPNYNLRFKVNVTNPALVGVTGGSQGHSHTLSDNGQAQVGGNSTQIWQRTLTTASYTVSLTKTGLSGTTGGTSTTGSGLAGTTDTNTDTRPPYIAILPGIKF